MKSAIFSKLESEYRSITDQQWSQLPMTELIYFVIRHFHYQHRHELPELIWTAEQLAQKGKSSWDLYELANRLRKLSNELIDHMEKEEQILFPLMQENNQRYLHIEYCIAHHHHDDHLLQLEFIEQQLGVLIATDIEEFIDLSSRIQHFIDELRLHIDIENRYLFIE